jgi:hypothetical protein
VQDHYLDTVMVAYIPPGAGALYQSNGKIKRNKIGERFISARRELLNANKRVLVDLRQVSDPEYRDELARVGVKASPVNAALLGSPGVSGHEILKPDIKPRRAPLPPKVVRASTFEGQVKLAELGRAAKVPPRAAAKPPARRAPAPQGIDKSTVIAIGLGGAVVITAAVVAHQLTKKRE